VNSLVSNRCLGPLLALSALILVNPSLHAQEVPGCPTASGNSVCLTTYQGGANRLGFNPNETVLTQSAITASTGSVFQKQFSVPVNGAIYSQPLVLPNVTIGGVTHADVAYVATEQDWVYAIDGATGDILWSVNLAPAGYTFLKATDVNGCINILPSPGDIGITGTPVIDLSANQTANVTAGVLYVVAKLKTTSTPYSYKQTFYALNVTTGATMASIDIGGTFNGITFNEGTVGTTAPYANTQNQRAALLAVPVAGQNPQIIISYASHCDHQNFPFNGWVMAYQLNAAQNALSQTAIWASVPANKSYEGGIWGGGAGPAADSSGHIYVVTGNGTFSGKISLPPNDDPTSCTTTPCNYGDSILEMQLSGNAFEILDFFTPFDWVNRKTNDYDLGSGGLMLLPNQPSGDPANLLAQAGKEGTIYLAQTSPVGSLGGYTGNGVSDATAQSLPYALCFDTAKECGVWGSPAWWSTTTGGGGSSGYAFWGGSSLELMQFKFYPNGAPCTNSGDEAGFCTTPTAQTSHKFSWPGPNPTVTATSTTATQAIVWAIDSHKYASGAAENLWIFDAATLKCLYSTDQSIAKSACTRKAPATDVPAGGAIKFIVPSVANGKVYIGSTGPASSSTQGYLNIYGIN
jgi:hypothetical protein